MLCGTIKETARQLKNSNTSRSEAFTESSSRLDTLRIKTALGTVSGGMNERFWGRPEIAGCQSDLI